MKKNSILVDATYINNGGGEILLNLLLTELDSCGFKVGLIVDKRVAHNLFYRKFTIAVCRPNPLLREFYIAKYLSNFDILLCFNNLGPFFKYSTPTFIYFHNVNYLEKPKKLTPKIFLQTFLFARSLILHKNWIVQTSHVKEKLMTFAEKRRFFLDVEVFPFFPKYVNSKISPKIRPVRVFNDFLNFIYVSDGHDYKNHKILLDAFLLLHRQGFKFCLFLTISDGYPGLLNELELYQNLGLEIDNCCNIDNSSMINFISKFDVSVYPSLRESLGLGLIESFYSGIPVLASDLAFVHQVLRPSIAFDPTDVRSIFLSLKRCFFEDLPETELVIRNSLNCFSTFLMSKCNEFN